MKIFAVIPARSGSKGIPGKNLAPLAGKPLIVHTIEEAQASGVCREVFVSTDSEEIAAVSRASGACVPALRPAELATDSAATVDVVKHAAEWIRGAGGGEGDAILLLQPTSPLRGAEDIRRAVEVFDSSGAPGLVSVTPAHPSPFWAQGLGEGGRLEPLFPGLLRQRQSLPAAYLPNGAIYLVRFGPFLAEPDFYPSGTIGYVMPAERSVDIDSAFDLAIADALLRNLNGQHCS